MALNPVTMTTGPAARKYLREVSSVQKFWKSLWEPFSPYLNYGKYKWEDCCLFSIVENYAIIFV